MSRTLDETDTSTKITGRSSMSLYHLIYRLRKCKYGKLRNMSSLSQRENKGNLVTRADDAAVLSAAGLDLAAPAAALHLTRGALEVEGLEGTTHVAELLDPVAAEVERHVDKDRLDGLGLAAPVGDEGAGAALGRVEVTTEKCVNLPLFEALLAREHLVVVGTDRGDEGARIRAAEVEPNTNRGNATGVLVDA
eukprot:gnl/Trimastix_PCT/475.p1 GENE.gnl/Trimastix_PCT/475~~gnl/Trimastix_PCT/475.p1  ORF type:complete len:193 (-),score=8.96 gnl/Trimastix_PCT/475:168-746(-)